MVLEYRVQWNLPSGGPGLSVFHGRAETGSSNENAAGDMVSTVRSFFDAIKTLFVSQISWTFPGEVLELDTSTGALTSVIPVTAPAAVVGTGTGSMAAPAGAKIRWFTPAIVGGRRLQGSTFLVPLTVGSYESNGTLVSTSITTLNNAAQDLLNEGVLTNWEFVVWSKTHGILADVTSRQIPDRVSVLRSRRD